jgi:subtilisin family serine protease
MNGRGIRFPAAAAVLMLAPALLAGTVPGRWIVELSGEPAARSLSRRLRVRQEQEQLLSRLRQRRARVLDAVDTVANALLVEADDISQLAALPGVKRVAPVRTFRMVLDRAVLLHKVAEAWNQVGNDRAGQGAKIAIIDSGIDAAHAGFQDPSLSPPDSFPRTSSPSDLPLTNAKVIVARSYVNLLPSRDPDSSARDRVGHGTALAMIAAGVRNAGPLATITGVAPKAWLGNYKVFGTPGFNDASTSQAILKAIDDAVSDGMDVINLSLGDDLAPRLGEDMEVQAVERAAKAGVIVVAAAGNNGPGLNTISSPATAPSAIAVGASTNDRTFSASVEAPGLGTFAALVGNGPAPVIPVTAVLFDTSALDGSGLACSPPPAGSLSGRIALILRGSCTFEMKLNNAQQAGAVAALVYAAQDSPDPVSMAVGAATLPAEMVRYETGIAIKQALASLPALAVTMRFTLGPVPVPALRPVEFSAAGPNVDETIKPDLVAVGSDVYTATQSLDARGDMYSSSGYTLVDGTSFSAPLVAGAAALLKSARPGLSVAQYRSLILNTTASAPALEGQASRLVRTGAGVLDVDAALRSTLAAYPALLSLGAGGPDPNVRRSLTLFNIGTFEELFTLEAPSGASEFSLAPGASVEVPLTWSASGLPEGTQEGFIAARGASSGTVLRIPYWYAVRSSTPAGITILAAETSGRRGGLLRDAFLIRVTDASGLVLTGVQPEVSVLSGNGEARGVTSYDSEVPGMFGIDVLLGPGAGANTFRITAGPVTADLAISGQ